MGRFKLFVFFTVLTSSVNAQMYFSGFCGYSFASNPVKVENIIVQDTMVSMFNARYLYGKGANLGFNVGYILNENMSLEVGFNTQVLTKSKFDNDWSSYNSATSYYYLLGINGYTEMENRNIQLSPLFIYTINRGRINPFIKAGLNFLYSQSMFTRNYTGLGSDDFTEISYKYTGEWSLGFKGAAGVSYRANKKLSYYCEFIVVNTQYKYQKSELTSYKVNGVDQMSTVLNKVTELRSNEGRVDYSQLGFNIGIKYNIKIGKL